ncbi:MAG: hypothetical protein EOP09_11795 [Proteobacteria bacterium]|nr:MAG: hypothetical protein EOP09_11795 [Pseudomonadota bacterium]
MIKLTQLLNRVRDETRGEIQIHLSRNPFEKDPMKRALEIFNAYHLENTSTEHNAVLVYLNLRKRKFAVVAGSGIHAKLKQRYWDLLAEQFSEDLSSTHYENALTLVTYSLLETYKKHYARAATP